DQRRQLDLSAEQLRLLERVHLDFVRAGARLSAAAQKRYAEVTEKLAELTTQFSQNVLADEADFQLILKDESDLAGLPDFLRAAAKQAAAERGVAGQDGGHVITLSRSLIVPFLTFSTRRDLRELAFQAWIARGEGVISTEGEHDNLPLIRDIMALRLEQAKLHGYACYADYALIDTMARTKEAVAELLKEVWAPAKLRAASEREAVQAFADAEHGSEWQKFTVQPWDWRYYAEKVRQVRYDLDDAAVKPYFSLDRMVDAAFDCAHRLFGLTFIAKPELNGYHADVKVYEVRQAGERLLGVFLHDNFARATKRGGAWMSSFRMQSRIDGAVTPIIVNNNNFAKGTPGQPTLLSFDDARTLFHEFGHGLHGLLSNVHYERLSGTQVLRDFVELPSQIFEHWLSEPEVLKRHARHYLTGEAIPDELIAKLKAARRFNQGIDSVEYTASALVDLAIHSLTDTTGLDAGAFEVAELKKIGMPEDIVMRHRLPHFRHLFAGSSYSSQYYVYLWAEVLDADGFEAFVEAGNPFDAAVAQRLLQHIYSAGNTRDPAEAYRAFRGRAPTVMPMLKKKGLVEA
ncbi:MAG: M3 family metallopeptidase, partial [Betaproteobacteria bacterium]